MFLESYVIKILGDLPAGVDPLRYRSGSGLTNLYLDFGLIFFRLSFFSCFSSFCFFAF